MTMRLYDYAPSCNAYKVRLLIARLGLHVERVEVDIFDGETLTDAFARLNPARTVPVLQLADGRALPESAAILWHLAERTGLLPDDAWPRAQVLRWMFWEQTEFLPAIGGLRFRILTGRWQPDEPAARDRRESALEVLSVLDGHLAQHAFIAGETESIADLALYGYAHRAHEARLPMTDFPAIGRWLERVASNPRHVDDVEPYPQNAGPRAGRSIYG
jgi:glutathione S-transferase